MNLFKIRYINNKPVSCYLVVGKLLEWPYTYDFIGSYLIYALIKARSEEEALTIAEGIAISFSRNQASYGDSFTSIFT